MSHSCHQITSKSNGKKANWFIIGVGVFLLLIGAGLVFSSPSKPNVVKNTGGNSTLLANEKFYDFGTISMAKGKVIKEFKIENPSPNAITVSKIYTSCMCTEASLLLNGKRFGPFGMPGHGIVPSVNQPLEPKAEAAIEVVFDPSAHGPAGVGPISRNIYVETTDGGKLNLSFKAQVTP